MAIRQYIDTYGFLNAYATLNKDANGFAFSVSFHEKPPANLPYARNFGLTHCYMNVEMAPLAEEMERTSLSEDDGVYVYVAVKDGYYTIRGLYVNDGPIETVIMKICKKLWLKRL